MVDTNIFAANFIDWLREDRASRLLLDTLESTGYATDAEFLKRIRAYDRLDWSLFFTRYGVPREVFLDVWRRFSKAARPA